MSFFLGSSASQEKYLPSLGWGHILLAADILRIGQKRSRAVTTQYAVSFFPVGALVLPFFPPDAQASPVFPEVKWSEVAQSWPTLCDPIDCSLPRFSPWDFPGKNTGVGCRFLLQRIFPTQGWNPGLPHCRQTLYRLSYQGSPCHCNHLAAGSGTRDLRI